MFRLASCGILISLLVVNITANIIVNDGASIQQYYAPLLKIGKSPQKFQPIVDAPLLSIKLNDTDLGVFVPGIGRWDDIQNKTELLRGKVIVAGFGYPIYNNIVSWQNYGVIGVVIGWGQDDDWLGFPEIAWANYPADETTIPCLTVTGQTAWDLETAQEKANRSSPYRISMTDGGAISPWRQVTTHWSFYFFAYGMAAMSMSVICAAFIKYREFFLAQGGWSPIAVPHVCMILETLGALIRFLFWSIDPLGAKLIFAYAGQPAFRTGSLPFALSSTLLLTFFWLETVSKANMQVSWNLAALKIPAYSLIAVLFLVEISVDVLYLVLNFTTREYLSIANALVYVVVCLGLGSFFLFTTIKIMLKLSKFATKSSSSSGDERQRTSDTKRREHLFSTAVKLSITGGSLFGILLLALLFSVRVVSAKPIPWTALWLLLHFCMNVKALSTIIAFRAPRRFKASSSSKSKSLKLESVSTTAAAGSASASASDVCDCRAEY